jgi:hypothetical protein
MSIEVASQNRPAAVRMADEQRTAMRSHNPYRHGLTNTTELGRPDSWTVSAVQRDGDGNASTVTLQVIEWRRLRARWMGIALLAIRRASTLLGRHISCRHLKTAGVSALHEQHGAL